MFYAIPTKGACKCCGRKFNYVTVKHKVLVASEEHKKILTDYCAIAEDALVDVDLKLLKRLNIPWIEIQIALQQFRHGTKNI